MRRHCWWSHFVKIVALFVAPVLSQTVSWADADRIMVTFYEGHFQQASTDSESKYSALVSVWRCNPDFQELSRFRGSTLPNPYWIYKDAVGKPFDIDGQLHDVFSRLDASNLEAIGLDGLRPLVKVFQEDKRYPIVKSGRYDFTVVDLRNTSHGRYESQEEDLFQPLIRTQIVYKANGILIHRGRHTGVNRDSEGCLTIDPNDWVRFIRLFPDPGYSGAIEVIREGSYPAAPRCLKAS